jgi:hypothetical protein
MTGEGMDAYKNVMPADERIQRIADIIDKLQAVAKRIKIERKHVIEDLKVKDALSANLNERIAMLQFELSLGSLQ